MKKLSPGSTDIDWVRSFYKSVNEGLNQTEAGEDAFFLNLGYIQDQSPSFAATELPTRTFDRESHRLILEVIGETDINEKGIVEVGCGRGGASYVLRKHFQYASYVGIDLTPAAVAFCREKHQDEKTRFMVGNAMDLPLSDNCADVVINIESSHNYGHIQKFYAGVKRILKPHGRFLYADSLSPKDWQKNRDHLKRLGLQIQRDTDITNNVTLACEHLAEKRKHLHPKLQTHATAEFLALPGSTIFKAYQTGELEYRILNLDLNA